MLYQQAPPPPPGVLVPKAARPKYKKYSVLAVAGVIAIVAGLVISSATLLLSRTEDYLTVLNLLKFVGYTVSQAGAAILAIALIYCGLREEELDSLLRARMIVASLIFLILFPLVTLFYMFPVRI